MERESWRLIGQELTIWPTEGCSEFMREKGTCQMDFGSETKMVDETIEVFFVTSQHDLRRRI